MDKKTIPRLVVPNTNDAINDGALAFKCVDKFAGDKKYKINQVVLYVPTKNQLTLSSFEKIVGSDIAKILSENGEVILPCGVPMYATTHKTLRFVKDGTAILAFWVDDNLMKKVDDLSGVTAIVAYPWPSVGLNEWIKTWSPLIIGQKPTEKVKLIIDPIIELAMESLTGMVNLSHHGLFGYDKEHADRFLRILCAKKHNIDPNAIKLWVINNGWHSGAAEDLEKIASRISSLSRKPSIKSISEGEKTYEYWLSNYKAEK
jgi:hypothetical protein